MNYFVEGLQGSGKSTLVKKISDIHPEYLVVHEGDYSPVELAWCAYMSKNEYESIIEKYHEIQQEILEKSHTEIQFTLFIFRTSYSQTLKLYCKKSIE